MCHLKRAFLILTDGFISFKLIKTHNNTTSFKNGQSQ